MKAAILKDKQRFSIEEIPKPEPKAGTAILKVSYCAVCGSDLSRFRDGVDFGVMGHEFCGEITQSGSELAGGWKVGDRVTVDPITYCHHCYWCTHGHENLCPNRKIAGRFIPGGYAEYIEIMPEQMFRTPDGLDDKEATMAQCLAVSLHAVRMADMHISDKVIVVGAGPIGLMVLQVARLTGAGKVIVIEKSQGRKRVAAQLGADLVLDAGEVSQSELVREPSRTGSAVVFECSGADTLNNSISLAGTNGKVIIVGAYHGITGIHSSDINSKEVTLKGSRAYTHEEFGQAVDLIASKKVNGEALITGIEPLENIQSVFEGLLKPVNQVKVLIAPHGLSS